jgi:hypothetical protein
MTTQDVRSRRPSGRGILWGSILPVRPTALALDKKTAGAEGEEYRVYLRMQFAISTILSRERKSD